MRKIHLKTFGCQMNEYDSTHVMRSLVEEGYTLVNTENAADIIIYNTCSVRQHAEDRVFGRLHQLRQMKKDKPAVLIGLMGCMVNAYQQTLLKDFPHLDFLAGTRDFDRIPELLKEIILERQQLAFITKQQRGFRHAPLLQDKSTVKTFVPIMRGCDNYCSYCVVPFVRGRESSRPSEEILEEITALAEHGVKEVMLLGQNVNSYGKQQHGMIDFSMLLDKVSMIEGIEVVRFMTSHPKDVSPRLFDCMQHNAKVEKHLHLPLQSGSNKILKVMDRNYSVDDFKRLVADLRERIPQISITTDIIVGFCGEEEIDYRQTKNVLRDIQFDSAFIFKYSPRKGTRAYTLQDTVPLNVKARRNNELLALQKEISLAKKMAYIGSKVNVLVEARGKKSPLQMKARTWTDKEVVFKGSHDMLGRVVTVRLTAIVNETFFAELIDK